MSKVGRENDLEIGPILACADTNAATDNILEGLSERNVKVVRLGRNSVVSIPPFNPFSDLQQTIR
jgi:hypothetical protein